MTVTLPVSDTARHTASECCCPQLAFLICVECWHWVCLLPGVCVWGRGAQLCNLFISSLGPQLYAVFVITNLPTP